MTITTTLKKRLKDKYATYIETVFNREIVSISKELGLTELPTLKLEEEVSERNSLMYVTINYSYEYSLNDFFNKTVIGTSTDSVVHVNVDYVMKKLLELKRLTGSKVIEYDALKVWFAHECRHIWQAKNGFYNGQIYNPLSFNLFDAHGTKAEEVDANIFALCYCDKNIRTKALALFLVTEQNEPKYNFGPSKELTESVRKVCSTYKETRYKLFTIR